MTDWEQIALMVVCVIVIVATLRSIQIERRDVRRDIRRRELRLAAHRTTR